MEIIDEIKEALDRAHRWIVLSHEKPDGDTLGSAIALAHVGRRRSKEILLGGPDPLLKYDFLLGDLRFEVLESLWTVLDEEAVVICVDTSTVERSVGGLTGAEGKCPVVNIDHHPDNARYGTHNWIDGSASATGEMIVRFLQYTDWGIEKLEAEALYVALVTDNGNFSYPSTTIHSHECAIALMRAGASPAKMAPLLDASLSANVLHLWSRALLRVSVSGDGLVGITWLDAWDFSETATTRSDTENLVNMLLKIRDVKIAALCSELEEGIRVNLRAKAPFNAREIAGKFGGGGHDLAAGCIAHGSIEAVVSRVRAEMEMHVATLLSADR